MPSTAFAAHASLTELDLEKGMQEILNLFLKSYFDGESHAVNPADESLASVEFPACDIKFNMASIPDAQTRPLIHVVFQDTRRGDEQWWRDEIRMIERSTVLVHYVRVAHQGQGEELKRAEYESRTVADRLRLLYSQMTMGHLSGKGIHHVRVERGPTPLAVAGYAVRMLTVTATLRYSQAMVAGESLS